jgi:3-oxoadipate enol-lactonase
MNIPFEEYGEGKPVILLHAFPLSRKMWQPQIEALVEAGCRVITPDFRGFGENENFADIHTMEDLAGDIAELLDELEIEKAIIGGLSMGGYVLFNLYKKHPEKFAALILADTNCGADLGEKRSARFELVAKIEADGAQALVENVLPNLISDFTKQHDSALVENLESEFSEVNPQAAIAALRGMAQREDHCDLLESISVPTLLIFGEHDKVTNLETGEKMHRAIKNSRLIKIENAGHYTNLEQPAQFNRALAEFVETIEI